jgi:hypothetical protein
MVWEREGIAGLPKMRSAVLELRRETCFVACGGKRGVAGHRKYESV